MNPSSTIFSPPPTDSIPTPHRGKESRRSRELPKRNEIKRKTLQAIDVNVGLISHLGSSSVRWAVGKDKARPNPILKEENERFDMKRKLAEVICSNNEPNSPTPQTKINRGNERCTANSVATTAFRKLEDYLGSGRSLLPISREGLCCLFNNLVFCRRYLPDELTRTYLQFVKASFGLEDVVISESSARQLYLRLLQLLRRKLEHGSVPLVEERGAERTETNKKVLAQRFWKTDIERRMLEVYRLRPSFKEIREDFKQLHPDDAHLFHDEFFRLRFMKIVRREIELLAMLSRHPHSQLAAMERPSRTVMDRLLRSRDSLNIRIQLIELYLDETYEEPAVAKAVTAINNYITMKEQQLAAEQESDSSLSIDPQDVEELSKLNTSP